jgi:hypothetical protein
MHEMMTRIYVARLREQGRMRRHSEARIREWLATAFEKKIDLWLTTDEAALYGFSDGVFDGDLKKLRATKKDLDRRARMLEVLRRPINVTVCKPKHSPADRHLMPRLANERNELYCFHRAKGMIPKKAQIAAGYAQTPAPTPSLRKTRKSQRASSN